MSPLRVLCIHGYRQNGSTFREKTGAFRKLLKKQVELIFVDAPLSVQHIRSPGCSKITQGGINRPTLGKQENVSFLKLVLQLIIYLYFRFDGILRTISRTVEKALLSQF